MKYTVLMIIFSLICCTFGLDKNYSPVLYFKNKEYKISSDERDFPSTIQALEQFQFEEDVTKLAANHKIVLLVADDLSPEDLKIRNVHNERGFQNLASNVNILKYLPYVENAANNEVTMNVKERYTLTDANELEPTPSDDVQQIMIVTLPECDSDETRFHCMARIDRACFALSNSEEYKDAIFMLTSKMNSHLKKVHSRRTRDTNSQTADNTGHIYPSPNSLVYFKKLLEHSKDAKGTDAEVAVSGVTSSSPNAESKEITITFTGKYTILLNFQRDNQNYILLNTSKSSIDGKQFNLNTELYMEDNFSYACASSLFFKFKKPVGSITGIYFENLQIQLNFTNTGANLNRFNEAFDCVGYTSPGIWSGLFLTLLLLSIISTGITYIMDIKTMDKFDDPKGKTITINPNE